MSKWNKYIEDEKQSSSRQKGQATATDGLWNMIQKANARAQQDAQGVTATQTQTLPQPKSAGQLWTSNDRAGDSAIASEKVAQLEAQLEQAMAQPTSKGKLWTLKDWVQGGTRQDAQEGTTEQTQVQAQAQASESAEDSSSDYDKILQSYRELASSQLDKLDLQRTEARREASVLSDRVTRYLPYLRRSGNTEGSGLSDTADIAAYNRVQNRYSEVDADFAEKQADIMDSYRQTAAAMAKEEADRKWQSQETAADREWQTAEAEANRAWQTEENEKNRTWQTSENDKQTSTGSYTDAATALGSWFESMADDSGKISGTDLSRLKAFADVFKENLSAADAAQLDVLLSGYESFVRSDTEQAVHDKQTAASSAQYETYLKQMAEAEKLQTYSGLASATVPASTGAGKNFNITLDGKTYKVQVKDTTTDAVVLQAAEMAGEDQPFILNGKMYLMTRGGGDVDAGTVFEIEAQFWDSHLLGRINGDDYKDLYKKITSSASSSGETHGGGSRSM